MAAQPLTANKALTYEELLTIIDEFMLKSGIREFCRIRCRGACCTFRNRHRCDHREQGCLAEPHLTCNAWLCDAICSAIIYLAERKNKNRTAGFLNYYRDSFRNNLIYRLQNLMWDCGHHEAYDAFLLPAPPSLKEKFSFPPCPGLSDEKLVGEISAIVSLLDAALADRDKNRGLLNFIKSQRCIPRHILECYLEKY